MKIVALSTCHNRRELTLRSLRALEKQILPDSCNLEICLVDDASRDGTGRAVRAAFPSVTVLDGSGSLFWAGGMRFGWNNFARHQQAEYLLVFNDDVELSEDAVAVLMSVARRLESDGCASFAVSGAVANPETGDMTYGGAIRRSWWHPLRFRRIEPTASIQECATVNMNVTLISGAALRLVGFLSQDFTHNRADYDFCLRLRAAGGRVILAPGIIGSCRVNLLLGTSRQAGLPFAERWRRLTGIKEEPPRERAIFYRRHGGWLWPLLWALPYVRMFMEAGIHFVGKSVTTGRAR